ncbi:MAG: hypothetical protein L3V56_02320 [Candidatus Magnetoovum sp. WYHC-5]|nr:hypothetical protein [Candidatus Magnetoovum sp. WYHC-5]
MDENNLFEMFIEIAFSTLMPLLAAFTFYSVSRVISLLRKKFDIGISLERERWLQVQAEKIVQSVAERAAFTMKWKQERIPAMVKQEEAIKSLTQKVPGLTEDEAVEHINAAVARIKGEGATGQRSLGRCAYTPSLPHKVRGRTPKRGMNNDS